MDARRLVTGAAEIRAAEDGQHLHGTLIQEGRAASGGRREVFTPGSVEWPSAGVGILTAHRTVPEVRAIPVRESDGKITVKAPATPAIREAVEGGRKFMSVEFHALEERTTKGGVREVLRAFVPDAALVDAPEYDSTSAEVRRRGGRLNTFIPKGRRMDCRCSGKIERVTMSVRRIEFPDGAWDDVLREIEEETREVLAIARGAGDVVATTGTGSLGLSLAAGGALGITMAPLDTEAGRRVEELVEAGVEVYARPVIDFEASEYEVEGDVARVRGALFSYILVKPTDRTRGLDPLKPRTEGRSRKLDRRRRIWL
ncbi:MAG: hypothetical protein OXK77_12605 [Gemmatimonadota bacterium]|nr:hypothetical protein [Gemmatimonadota bacterium]MDE2864094.1 hypothetical protein [Gemmatimonadota bacterium]